MQINFNQTLNLTAAQQTTISNLVKDAIAVPSKSLLEGDGPRKQGVISIVWQSADETYHCARISVKGKVLRQASTDQ